MAEARENHTQVMLSDSLVLVVDFYRIYPVTDIAGNVRAYDFSHNIYKLETI